MEEQTSSELPQLEYLHPSDSVLIQPFLHDIIANATQFLDNLHSDKMKNYNKFHHLVYSKYAGRKYKIETPLNQIIVTTAQPADKKKTIIHIHKPSYIQISTKLAQYRTEISEARTHLDTHYYYIKMLTTGITPVEKDDFIKQKNNFINLLKKYYTILTYIKLRESYNSNNVTTNVQNGNITVGEIVNNPKDISGTITWVKTISNKFINVPLEQIQMKQQRESDKLNQYNEILTLLENKSLEGIKDKIKAYFDNTTDIEYSSTTDNYADLIITDLPQIIMDN